LNQIPQEHRSQSPQTVRCVAITVSDTRTFETDTGGQTLVDRLTGAGHTVVLREIIPDEPRPMRELLTMLRDRHDVDAILMTGGTGLGSRDRTFETVEKLLDKTLPGYGELFRMLSYQEIGSAAMLSRATAGLIGGTVLLTMPGSPEAVELALEKLILPELGHLVHEARK
jgi:molybdenum cofactor biosynthesis protein B